MERAAAVLSVGLLLGAAAACGHGDRAGGAAGGDGEDTGVVGGLTREQLQARAEAMSPEKAESLGIVQDTGIHVELPSGDTIPEPGPVGSPVPPDTGR